MPEIELLTRSGCPTTAAFARNLRAALARQGHEPTFTVVDLETLPEEDWRRGFGTPTLLIDGRDPFGASPAPPPFDAPS